MAAQGGCFRTVPVGSLRLVFDVSDVLVRRAYLGGQAHEPDTTRFIQSVLRPGDTVVDVGANRGYFTVLGAVLVGATGRVVAFEPIPRAVEALRRHLAENHIEDRVTVIEAAVADTDNQTLELHIGADADTDVYASLTPSEFAVEHGWLTSSRTIPVRTCTLDAWSAEQRPAHIRLVKIDVEGAEVSVVRGMATMLRTVSPDYIVCETMWGQPAHEHLCSSGYIARRLECSGDYGNILYTRAGLETP